MRLAPNEGKEHPSSIKVQTQEESNRMEPFDTFTNPRTGSSGEIDVQEIPLEELSEEDRRAVESLMNSNGIEVRGATTEELIEVLGFKKTKEILDKYGKKS